MYESAAALLGIDTSAIDQLQRRALDKLVHDFAEVLSTGKWYLGHTDRIYHLMNQLQPYSVLT